MRNADVAAHFEHTADERALAECDGVNVIAAL